MNEWREGWSENWMMRAELPVQEVPGRGRCGACWVGKAAQGSGGDTLGGKDRGEGRPLLPAPSTRVGVGRGRGGREAQKAWCSKMRKDERVTRQHAGPA